MTSADRASATSTKPLQELPPSYAARLIRALSDQDRLTALRAYQILDTEPEAAFDNLAKLAGYICETPVSLVTFLEQDRQFFKAMVGYNLPSSIPQEITFCQHILLEEDLVEIEDVTLDVRFRDNPFVANTPNVRFYASAPIITADGHKIGSICAFDFKPHRLTHEQRDALRTLAREAVLNLELRQARVELERGQQDLDDLLRLINDNAESGVASSLQELFVKQNNKLVRLNTADISYIEALGDYVNIYAGSGRYTVYTTMKELLQRLPVRDFVRVHRKYIVNIDSIIAIAGDALTVDTNRKALVLIGSSYKADLMSRLNVV
ncbi:GAF domain-containing DNA-binding protein [Hymenobacter koreensis]|uniref:HTH LytTR-type domain-containing protein n=1 Tax=Hymenobacter koreensis TaxID=1084523 RepID=A0ABP8IVJ3_9BACT